MASKDSATTTYSPAEVTGPRLINVSFSNWLSFILMETQTLKNNTAEFSEGGGAHRKPLLFPDWLTGLKVCVRSQHNLFVKHYVQFSTSHVSPWQQQSSYQVQVQTSRNVWLDQRSNRPETSPGTDRPSWNTHKHHFYLIGSMCVRSYRWVQETDTFSVFICSDTKTV